MKNLKKVLAFVTMFTMLLSVAVSAGTLYPDVDDNASYAEAVETLNALGIMIGDDKGNFNPDASITRAETAAIVTRIKALGEAASAAGGTNFSDVPADHWAAGYINLAEQSKIINGYGDGTFGPSDAVTYEQVIKMIVAALGYTPEADTKGGYPTGYLIIANRENITKGVSVTPGAEAPRAAVARLVFNALDVPLMEQANYGTGDIKFETTDHTCLNWYLKVDKYEGVVTDTYLTVGDSVEDDSISIQVDSKNGNKVAGAPVLSFAEGKTNATPLFGNWVVAYVADDEETGEATLIGITKKSGKNTEITIDYTQVEAYETAKITYFKEGTNNELTLDIDGDVNYYYNGKADTTNEVVDFLTNLVDDESDAVEIGTLTLIDCDNDNDYDYIMLMKETHNYVVSAVDAAAKRLEDKNTGLISSIDVDNENMIITFLKADGTVAEFADIKEGDVLTTYENGNLMTIYISDAKVEGTVKEKVDGKKDDDAYSIADGSYRVAYENGSFVLPVSVGEEGIFYLNHIGRIVAKDAKAASGSYAYLLNAAVTSDIHGDSIEIKYVTSEGVVETALLASKVTKVVDGQTVTTKAPVEIASEFDPLFVVNTDGDGKKTVTLGTAGERLFQFTKNSSDKIYKIFIVGTANEEGISLDRYENAETYKASMKKLGGLYFNDETLVLSVAQNYDAVVAAMDEDDVTVTKVSAFFSDDTTYDCRVEGYDLDSNGVPAIVVVYNANADILESTKGLLITKISTISSGNDTIRKVYGYQNGVEVSVEEAEDDWTVLDRAGNASVAVVEPGDFVIFSLDANGKIDKVQILMDASVAEERIKDALEEGSDAEWEIDSASNENTRHIFGFAQKKVTGKLQLGVNWYEGAASINEEGKDYVLNLPMNGKDISFYEVNRGRTPNTYAVASFGDIVTEDRASIVDGTKRTSNWVYVREYDGVVMDVVIYTATNPYATADVTIKLDGAGNATVAAEKGAKVTYKVVGVDTQAKAYTTPVALEEGQTIEAYAVVAGKLDGTASLTAVKAAVPTITVAADGAVTITAADGATIMYKVGDAAYAEYTESTTVTLGNDETITAYAVEANKINSAEASETYTVAP